MAKADLLIRADASARIGVGHLMRCIALAQAWQAHGATVRFACCHLPELFGERLRKEDFDLFPLDVEPGSEEDAVLTAEAAEATGAVAVVVDGYCFGRQYQRRVRSGTRVLMVIDDYGMIGEYDADILLDQNLGTDPGCLTTTAIPNHSLLGPAYSLLRREYWAEIPKRQISRTATRVFVNFGGSDPFGLGRRVMKIFEENITDRMDIRLVSGPAVGKLGQRSSRHNLEVFSSRESLLSDLLWADLGVLAAGSTTLEALATGLPMLVLPVAENQKPVGEAISRLGVGVEVRPEKETSWPKELASTVSELLRDFPARDLMSKKGRAVVDGCGAVRVVSEMRKICGLEATSV